MGLIPITLAYLLLPLVIFVLGWLRWPLAFPLAGLLIASVATLVRSDVAVEETSRPFGGRWPWVLLTAVTWVILSGDGPFGYQNSDWVKHNAVLKDLITKPWPVFYADVPWPGGAERPAMVYYVAYYLPAACAGKLLGWDAAYVCLFVWTILGVLLTLLWFSRLTGSSGPGLLLIFIFASGLDAPGYALMRRALFTSGHHLEWWAQGFQFSSNTTLLAWVPHQALGAWLATAIVIDRTLRDEPPWLLGLVLIGCLFWSPLASLGLLPFLFYWWARRPKPLIPGWRNWTICPLLLVVLVSFFASHATTPPHHFALLFHENRWARYLVFVTLEAGLYVALCAQILRRDSAGLRLLVLAAVSLLLIPLYRFGLGNDWVMRGSIPALFVLWVFVAKSLTAPASLYRRILVCVFIVGAITPIQEIVRSLRHFRVAAPKFETIRELPVAEEFDVARQYIGDRNSFFFKYLARDP